MARELSERADGAWLRLRRALPGGRAGIEPDGPATRDGLLAAAARPPLRAAALAWGESGWAPLAAHPSFRVLRGVTHGPATAARFEQFEHELVRAWPRPRVFLMDQAAVMGWSHLVVTRGVPVRESTYLLARRQLPEHAALSLAEPLLDLTGDDTTWIVAANAPRRNYWHWIGQVMPAVLQSMDELRGRGVTRMGLVTLPMVGFQREVLRLLGLDALPVVELRRGQTCLCARLAYCDALSGGGTLVAPTVHRRAVREAMLAASAGAPSLGDRLYVSRSDSQRRPLSNAAEVEARLAREGFMVLTPGRLPLREQVMAFHNARLVVGPHGAGLSNVLFCRPGATVLELTAAGQGNAMPASLARTSGARICLDVFPNDPGGNAPGAWKVDVDRMMASLGRLA